MQRSRIGIMGAAAAMLSAIGSHGLVRGGIRRVTSDSKAGRQMMSATMPRHRSKYRPHIGVKEQERAKRLWKSEYLNQGFVDHCARQGYVISSEVLHERSTPTLMQRAKS